eukprot:m51a1_g11049 hypothetical protein (778) ;mRNA; r:501787-504573
MQFLEGGRAALALGPAVAYLLSEDCPICPDADPTSPSSESLRSLRAHIARSPLQTCASVLSLASEKALGLPSGAARSLALAQRVHECAGRTAADALRQLLAPPTDKRVRLGACALVRHAAEATSAIGSPSTASEGTVERDGEKLPTRLAVAAVDALVSLAACADVPADPLCTTLATAASWHQGRQPLCSAAYAECSKLTGTSAWAAVAPFAVEERSPRAKWNTRAIAAKLVEELEAAGDVQDAMPVAVRLAFLLGRMSRDKAREAAPQCLSFASRNLSSAGSPVRSLAVSFMRWLLPPLTPETASSAVPMLLSLLDARDDAACAAAAFAAEIVSRNLALLSRVFEELSSDARERRQNALAVLEHVASSRTEHGSGTDLSRAMAGHLLRRLGDSELSVRAHAARLFADADPEYILPRLVALVASRDHRERSAASESIVHVMQHHAARDLSRAMSALVDSIRDPLSPAEDDAMPTTPADLCCRQSKATERDGKSVEVVLELTRKWTADLTEESWRVVAEVCLSKLFANPADHLIVAIAREFLSRTPAKAAQELVPGIVKRMAEQDKLTEQILNAQDPEPLKVLLFERLSAVLAIKLLPPAAVDTAADAGLLCELLSRITAVYEFDEQVMRDSGIGRPLADSLVSTLRKSCASESLRALQRTCVETVAQLIIVESSAPLDDLTESAVLCNSVVEQLCCAGDESSFRTCLAASVATAAQTAPERLVPVVADIVFPRACKAVVTGVAMSSQRKATVLQALGMRTTWQCTASLTLTHECGSPH